MPCQSKTREEIRKARKGRGVRLKSLRNLTSWAQVSYGAGLKSPVALGRLGDA